MWKEDEKVKKEGKRKLVHRQPSGGGGKKERTDTDLWLTLEERKLKPQAIFFLLLVLPVPNKSRYKIFQLQ